jgi:hypothetical protein
MINDNWMRSISKSYTQLNEQQMMMGMQGGMQQSPMPQQQKKRYHYPFRKQTQGPIQDEGPASVEPPKQQGMPFPGPGMPGEIPGPSGLPIAGREQSMPMMGQMGQMGQMGMGQPQIQIARLGTFKQPFGELPGQVQTMRQAPMMGQMGQMGMGQAPMMGQMGQAPMMGQMGQMGQMGMGQAPMMGQMGQMGMGQAPMMGQMGQMGQMGMGQMGMGQMGQAPMMGQMGQPQFGAPGQSIQKALSRTRPITKIQTLENPGIPDDFRYAPRPDQQPQMGQMGQMGRQMPQIGRQMPQTSMGQIPQMGQMGQMPEQGGEEQTGPSKKLSSQEIKTMFDRFKKKGMKNR